MLLFLSLYFVKMDFKILAKRFVAGENTYGVDAIVWISAFRYIALHHEELIFNQQGIHLIWTVSGGHIRNKVRDDELILKVLKLGLPKYEGQGIELFRGECRFLYEGGKLGFCWTPVRDVAEMFARGLNAIESGGVLLRCYAPQTAILAAPNDHSASQMQEFEFTCDPGKLENIRVIKNFPRLSDNY